MHLINKEMLVLLCKWIYSELFLTQPLESHCAPAAGNYQVKRASPWIIQCALCTIKSSSNHSMLPNNYVSVHTWISAMNNKHNKHVTATHLASSPNSWSKYAIWKRWNDKDGAERLTLCWWKVKLSFTLYSLSFFVLWQSNLFWHIRKNISTIMQLQENANVLEGFVRPFC